MHVSRKRRRAANRSRHTVALAGTTARTRLHLSLRRVRTGPVLEAVPWETTQGCLNGAIGPGNLLIDVDGQRSEVAVDNVVIEATLDR